MNTSDYIQQKLDLAIKSAHDTLPVVTKTILEVTRWDCISQVAWSVFWITLSLVVFGTAFVVQHRKNFWEYRSSSLSQGAVIFSSVGASFSLFGGLIGLIDPWNWVCVYHPDIYLVHAGIQKLLTH